MRRRVSSLPALVAVCVVRFVAGTPLLAQTAVACESSPQRAPATGNAPTLSRTAIGRIDSVVSLEMAREHIPGLSIVVITDRQRRWERNYGFADLEACVPVTRTTVYRLASVSKTITAAAVMKLAEQGRIDLDVPIQRYVPSFPTKSRQITARELLSHLSGIRHYLGDEDQSVREYASLTDAFAIFGRDTLVAPPGTQFVYSTYGYTVLGAAVEQITGQRFVAYLRSNIFLPLGISSIRDDSVAALIPHRARAYSRDSSGVIRNSTFLNSSYKIPGGGLISTAADLARFGYALETGEIVRESTFAQMAHKARTTNGSEVPYGYGLIIGQIRDILPGAVWHAGVQQGATSVLYLLPEDRISIAVLTNLEGIPTSLSECTNEIARIVRDDERGPASMGKPR